MPEKKRPDAEPDAQYVLGADSLPQEGVPQGRVTQHTWESAHLFPGTVRDYWLYVPAQYDPKNPAGLMVYQDGGRFVDSEGSFRTPSVADNLIHKGEMPVMLMLFVDPGTFPEGTAGAPIPNTQRSIEYDTLGDRYVRFLLDELIEPLRHQYNLTDDPERWGIGGASSGAIAAWTAAWERPNTFRRVLSYIGSYTDIRGGHNYPPMIRKTPPRPIRIFMQSGRNDLNTKFGNWPLANHQMASALEFAGYDYRFVFGEGRHSGVHGGAILPDALRWLFREEKPKGLRAMFERAKKDLSS